MTDDRKFRASRRPAARRSDKRAFHSPHDEQEEADRQTRGLAALALMLALLIVSLVLVHRLFEASAIQDCLMEGRANCGGTTVTAAAP